MKARFFLGALSIALAGGLAAGADAAPDPQATDDIQDIVFFGETRPVLIRLHIVHAGQSYQAAWEEFLHYLLAYLDTDKNGVVSKDEAARTPPAEVLFSSRFLYPGQFLLTGNPDQLPNRDGPITIEDLRRHYRQSGTHFQIQVQPGRARAVAQQIANRIVNQPPSAVALNDLLYRLLDANRDGQLSRDEMFAAPERLLPRDADDDEVVTGQEIFIGADATAFRMNLAARREASGGDPNPTFLALMPGESPANLVVQLLTRYGTGATGERKLTRQSSGVDEASFNQLDRNGDGALGSDELSAFIHRLPDLELTYSARQANQTSGQTTAKVIGAPAARLDNAGGGPVGQLLPAARATSLSANLNATPDGAMALELSGTTKLEFRAGGDGADLGRSPTEARDLYKARFGDADQDKNGYLDENEARSYSAFDALFKRMDLDGDGKLTEKELLAYFDRMQELRAKVATGCASLSVVDQGGGLFDLLDGNGDGRLSLRELRLAGSPLEKLDRNRDGCLSKNEIPHSYIATVVRGPLDATPVNRGMFMNAGPAPAPPATLPPATGPLWFRKMDRNQDGDVSRREFVSTDEQFARIDADGDGLISAEEAARTDASLRAGKDPGR